MDNLLFYSDAHIIMSDEDCQSSTIKRETSFDKIGIATKNGFDKYRRRASSASSSGSCSQKIKNNTY